MVLVRSLTSDDGAVLMTSVSTAVMGNDRQGLLLLAQAVDSFEVLRESYEEMSEGNSQADKDVEELLDYFQMGLFSSAV